MRSTDDLLPSGQRVHVRYVNATRTRHAWASASRVVALRSALRSALLAALAAPLAACQHVTRPVAIGACSAGTPSVTAATGGSGERLANPLATFDTAWAIVARSHWDTTYNGTNWAAVRDSLRPRAAEARTAAELRPVLSAMIATLRQSHFSIIPAEASEPTGARDPEATASNNADHSGTLGAEFRRSPEGMMLTRVDPAGPAAAAGLRAGYVLRAVDGCAVDERLATLPAAADERRASLAAWAALNAMLAGAPGDTARVVADDDRGRRASFTVVRGTPHDAVTRFGNLPPMAAHLEWERRAVGGRTVGVIRFNIWMPVLSAAFGAAIDSLRGADAIVIDLRGNFGGLGAMATGVAGHFLDSALTLGSMMQRGSTQKFLVNPQRVDGRNRRVAPFSGPLALVVDELSISTSEIFAGGLQAVGRARVFGGQTAGQALPSVAERLPDGDVLYHAVANFLSANGQPLEGPGVMPDVVVARNRRALLAGRDPALDAALAWAARAPGPARKASVSPRGHLL